MAAPDGTGPEIAGAAPLPATTIRIRERGFTIDRRKALIAAAVCWAGFAVMVWLVANGRTSGFDETGLTAFRSADGLESGWHPKMVEAIRDVTAMGGVLLRNLFALGAVIALLFLSLRREAVLFGLTVSLGWLANTGLKQLYADRLRNGALGAGRGKPRGPRRALPERRGRGLARRRRLGLPRRGAALQAGQGGGGK